MRTPPFMHLVLSAMDADVIKTYVNLSMGLIAAIAYDERRDPPAARPRRGPESPR